MSNKIQANGIDINYVFDGPQDAPVLMLSNSLASNLHMWDAQVEALASKFRILRADTRGHGKTEVTNPPYTIQLLLDDAIALLDALQIQKVHFCGLSLGGMIGQRFGAFHGDRLHSLTLCDTTSQMRDPSIWDERMKMAKERGMAGIQSATMTRWFTQNFLSSGGGVIKGIEEMIEATPLVGFLGCCEAIKEMNQVDILNKIQSPTLVIVGEDDQSTPLAAAQFLKENIEGSELVVIKSAAHLANVEQHEAFNVALGAHIEQIN